jgi:hypothetical protein
VIIVLTDGEQGDNYNLSDAVKREITQGLQEGHGLDKGVAITDTCKFFDFETCEEIDLQYRSVRCIACMLRAVCGVAHLSSASPHEPHATRCNSQS